MWSSHKYRSCNQASGLAEHACLWRYKPGQNLSVESSHSSHSTCIHFWPCETCYDRGLAKASVPATGVENHRSATQFVAQPLTLLSRLQSTFWQNGLAVAGHWVASVQSKCPSHLRYCFVCKVPSDPMAWQWPATEWPMCKASVPATGVENHRSATQFVAQPLTLMSRLQSTFWPNGLAVAGHWVASVQSKCPSHWRREPPVGHTVRGSATYVTVSSAKYLQTQWPGSGRPLRLQCAKQVSQPLASRTTGRPHSSWLSHLRYCLVCKVPSDPMAWQWPATEWPVCKQPKCMNYKNQVAKRKCSIFSSRNCTQYSLAWVFLPFVHVVF